MNPNEIGGRRLESESRRGTGRVMLGFAVLTPTYVLKSLVSMELLGGRI